LVLDQPLPVADLAEAIVVRGVFLQSANSLAISVISSAPVGLHPTTDQIFFFVCAMNRSTAARPCALALRALCELEPFLTLLAEELVARHCRRSSLPRHRRRLLYDDHPYSNIPRGSVMDTTQFGISTTSLILRSPATLQMA